MCKRRARWPQQLLGEKATQNLGDNYHLNSPPVVANPVVTAQEKNGVIYLSVSVHGVWFYQISQQQIDLWRQSIKGATSQLAQAFMNQQPGVAQRDISNSPLAPIISPPPWIRFRLCWSVLECPVARALP